MSSSQLGRCLLASMVSSTHRLNFSFSAQALQLSLNSKRSSDCQNYSQLSRLVFLLLTGRCSWLSQSQWGSLGFQRVVLRYSQSRNLLKLLSSKLYSTLVERQWLTAGRASPKAWTTHFGCSISLAATGAPCAQNLNSIYYGSYSRHALQWAMSVSCLGLSQTRLFLRGTALAFWWSSSSCSALSTRLRQLRCSSLLMLQGILQMQKGCRGRVVRMGVRRGRTLCM